MNVPVGGVLELVPRAAKAAPTLTGDTFTANPQGLVEIALEPGVLLL